MFELEVMVKQARQCKNSILPKELICTCIKNNSDVHVACKSTTNIEVSEHYVELQATSRNKVSIH